ncbi:histone-lysine N-methyltransferase SETDB2 [Trichosurus vulpecula]|uniref:histone-lysine N-methyltransferase SETDB2 n=1 Tax=Trichosurus vulpecula TaxID=9337 RepID=UPI00186AD033|nr:histone-lysine N-methyltransferase SETDB2 [Trichosurus vulpecula]
MEERNGDAKAFWRELEEDGKVDLIFEHVQNVLLSLKQKIKDGSATNQEYIQAMTLVNEAVTSNTLLLIKDDDITDRESEQESKSSVLPPTSHEDSNSEDSLILKTWGVRGPEISLTSEVSDFYDVRTVEDVAVLALENEVSDYEEKIISVHLSYQNHICCGTCLSNVSLTSKVENPLMIPILSSFQRRHAKTNSNCAAFHVNYKTPCGRSLRNFKEVHRYLLETECSFLFLHHFSFNTYVQLNRNTLKKEAFVSDSDISHGTESVPVTFCNEIDNRRLPHFKYRRRTWPHAYYLNNFSGMFSNSCDCSKGCMDIEKCACLQLTAKGYDESSAWSSVKPTHGYSYKRLQQPVPNGIFECSLLCKCDPRTCQNRVVQQGLQVRLQVFKTEKKGWGVRCLDDIDKGTFVCTYSGRLLSRAGLEEIGSVDGKEEEEEDITTNDNGSPALSKKRRTEAVYSDPEIEFVQIEVGTIPGDVETEEYLIQLTSDADPSIQHEKYEYDLRIENQPATRRPKTKAALLQNFRKKGGIITLESGISSEEEDEAQPTKVQPIPNINEKKRESSCPGENSKFKQLTNCTMLDNHHCKEESLMENTCDQAASGCDATGIKEREVQEHVFQEERMLERQDQEILCDEESLSETQIDVSESVKNLHEDSIYLLDATKEGNVGRFLNHSCNPNLFVQNVFVETHDRNFPWVAFFTKRHVKAGTELTWDYGYEAGSMPEKEIPCQCGFHTCRKRMGWLARRGGRRAAGESRLSENQDRDKTQSKTVKAPVRGGGAPGPRSTQPGWPERPGLPARWGVQRAENRHPHPVHPSKRKRNSTRAAERGMETELVQPLGITGEKTRAAGPDLRERRSLESPGRRTWSCLDFSPSRPCGLTPSQLGPGCLSIMMDEAVRDPAGIFQQRMVKITCDLCPQDDERGVLYVSQDLELVAHQNCLLYSSGLVESEGDHACLNDDRHFDVEPVKEEINRGKRLKCSYCLKKGATVGCDVKKCSKNYHFFCARQDQATMQADEHGGTYKVFCQKHTLGKSNRVFSTKVDMLKKMKNCGLIEYLFESLLEDLDGIHFKIKDNTTSEKELQEIANLLFDSAMFRKSLRKISTDTMISKLQSEQKHLEKKIEALQDIRENLFPPQKDIQN